MEAQRTNKQKKFQIDDFDQKAIFLCQFCGGVECQQQNYLKNKIKPNAIQGLHSNWITNQILAMQRPSERLIKQYNIYQKFKERNIRSVLNLQEPGEHPYCGDGIIPNVGFSYIPQRFYAHGINCFSECWQDMTATTFEHMMRIMNIFSMSLKDEGRIAVHCHAGRGRTLLVICSWLIYNDHMTAQQTIDLAVQKRQGVLTRSSQRDFLKYFQQQLSKRWKSFGAENHESFTEYCQWQTTSLLKHAQKQLHKLPILHVKMSKQIRRFIKKYPKQLLSSFLSPYTAFTQESWQQKQQKQLQQLKLSANMNDYKWVKKVNDPRIIVEMLYDFYEGLPYTLVTALTVNQLRQHLQTHKNIDKSHLKVLMEPAIVHDLGVSSLAALLDFAHLLRTFSQIINQDRSQQQKQQQNIMNNSAIDSICMRFALLLLSKKKFFPHVFTPNKPRDSQILANSAKAKKRVNNHVIFLAQFLKKLSTQLPEDIKQVHKLIFKACQVDSNLYSLTMEASDKLLGWSQSRQLYDNSRLKSV